MARLMQRVRSISPTGEVSQPRPAEKAEPHAARQPEPPAEVKKPVEPPANATSPAAAAPIFDLSELAPRSLPAESTSNISAMRDLANMTARSAIDTHQSKRMTGVIYSKLAVAITALAGSVALAWMSNEQNHVSYAAALVSMIVGVVWGLQYLLLTGSRLFQSIGSDSDEAANAQDAAD
jgi:hypothetical protein